jgi:hypothetical protein
MACDADLLHALVIEFDTLHDLAQVIHQFPTRRTATSAAIDSKFRHNTLREIRNLVRSFGLVLARRKER